MAAVSGSQRAEGTRTSRNMRRNRAGPGHRPRIAAAEGSRKFWYGANGKNPVAATNVFAV